RSALPATLLVVEDVQGSVGGRRREPAAVSPPDVPIVEVKPARTEDLRGEIELLPPVSDDRPAEKAARPLIHLGGDLLRGAHEHVVAVDGQLQVSLVVE